MRDADHARGPSELALPPLEEPWRRHWFPVAFLRDLAPDRVERVEVLGRALALFLDVDGAPAALVDRCPHRAARLSDGRAHAGTVECLYHGWRFDRDGRCVAAPQQPAGTDLPARCAAVAIPVRVAQGIVWVFGGAEGRQGEHEPPLIAALEGPDVRSVDFVMDLPYGQDALIENVLDIAHIHVAHAGTRSGGDERLAGPLEFEIEHEDTHGFRASFRTRLPASAPRTPGLARATVEFRAPNLVHYVSEFEDPTRVSGLALYSTPCDAGSTRLLYRAYGNGRGRADQVRPRWREHLDLCRLLEEDMAVVQGQAAFMAAAHDPPAVLWLPLRTSDNLVIRHRQWIERHALGRPGAIGWRTRGAPGAPPRTPRLDRWTLHTRHCQDCRAALARCERHARGWQIAAACAGALAVAVDGPGAALGAVAALLAWACSRRERACARALTLVRGEPDPGRHAH